MNRIFSLLLSFITAFSFSGIISFSEIPAYMENLEEEDVCRFSDNAGFVKDTLLVVFDEDASFFDKLSVFSKSNGYCIGTIRDLNLYIIRTDIDTVEDADKISRNITSLDSVSLALICPAKRYALQYTPDDPFRDDYGFWNTDWDDENPEGNNWHIEATDTRSAWGYKSLMNEINIGVVDGGFDLEHEELAGKIVFPSGREERRNRPSYHGTHVAGIIAANQDNGVGVSGICPHSTLICVDWSPSTNQLWIPDLEILVGFKKVVKAGAKVVNISAGSSGSVPEESYKFPSIVKNFDALFYSYAMGNLLSRGYDFVVVQSAGNGNDEGYAIDASENGIFCSINESNTFLPFSGIKPKDLLNRIIIVGSVELKATGYEQSSTSNVGNTVNICAPGVDILSCTNDNTYGRKSGTSMASPVVAGVAGLVWSVNPDLTGEEVRKIVCENTDTEIPPTTEERYFDFLDYRSYPMVNAKLSVEAALMKKGNFYEVEVSTDNKTEIIFTNEKGETFIFETNSDGNLECVLEEGVYTAKTELNETEFTVNENTIIEL